MKLKSNASIARRLAAQTCGEVQKQQKIGKGIWSFYTAGHGGYIVDTDIHTSLKEYNGIVYTRSNSNRYYPHEQHFAAFEEDCDYAIVSWLYLDHVLPNLSKNYNLNGGYNRFMERQKEYAHNSLARWNPDVLAKYPEPNMGLIA